MLPPLSNDDARTLLMSGQRLLDDPARRAGPVTVQRVIEDLGYIQLDSINVVARAHDLTLASRLDHYRPSHLKTLLEKRRSLFEHWTHDAAAIPVSFLPHWRRRFQHYAESYRRRPRYWERLGPEPEKLLRAIVRRIRRDGPLRSRDFEPRQIAHTPKRGWWDWGFEKAALEYLWRTGRLVITRRENFQKVYDLRENVFPQATPQRGPSEARYLDWACRAALERIGAGTPAEIAHFFGGLRAAQVSQWCARAARRGDVESVQLEGAGGARPRQGVAVPDWRERVARAPGPPDRMRLLSPFDPVVRDRTRLLRLFDFDYRIEVFVPAPKRRYGYYVLPILEGDRLVGRLDPKLHRERGVLEIKGLWWEPGVRATPKRTRALRRAIERTASLAGAEDIQAKGL